MENEVRRALAGRLKAGFGLESEAFISVPGRTELIGNHTDHQRGCVVAAAVTLSLDAAAARTGDGRIHVLSEGMEPVDVALDSLDARPSERGSSAALVRGVAAGFAARGFLPGKTGLALAVSAGVPVGSGLSSSACFEVLVAAAMDALLFGSGMSAAELARIAQFAENEYFGKPCGLMDQLACASGGISAIDFADARSPRLERLTLDLDAFGYTLCLVDSGAGHENLTAEYAAIAAEMRAVAGHFGREVLRDVPERDLFAELSAIRAEHGDRAALRAMHFAAENRRAREAADAIRGRDIARLLELIRESGRSSGMYLQNLSVAGETRAQPLLVAQAVCEHALAGRGAVRVHGGGFAGSLLALVPGGELERFRQTVDAVLGGGAVRPLHLRERGIAIET